MSAVNAHAAACGRAGGPIVDDALTAGPTRSRTCGNSWSERLSVVNDAKLRRCRCCGEWAWHLDPCTVCSTPAPMQAAS
jgi:hypothetical protein